MINICLGHRASGKLCDLISKDIFQQMAGNQRASFLTNEEERNFGSPPWGAIIIEARFSCCTCRKKKTGGLTYLIGHVKTTLPGQGKSENALEKHKTHYVQRQTKTHSEAGETNYYQEGHTSDIFLPPLQK